jgi:tetratricopeptide (TPR) repeat protein
MTDSEWESRVAAAWAAFADDNDDDLVALMAALAEDAPVGTGIGDFERAAAYDSTGRSDLAVPLYRSALAAGLDGERRRRAVIQLSSSLRNLGEAAESVALLTVELHEASDHLDDAVHGFLALALVDVGREREAVSHALGALAPHLPRYQRSLGAYARLLVDPDRDPT